MSDLLDQTCSQCGFVEAAGSYCTQCYTPTVPARDFHPPKRSVAQDAVAERLAANRTEKSVGAKP